VFRRDRLVRDPGVLGHRPGSPATDQPLTPDQARPQNRNVVQTFTPNQAVVPVIVPVILIVLPWLVRFRRIVTLRWIGCRIRRHNRRSLIQKKRHVTFQMNRVAKILSGSEVDSPTARGSRRLDRAIDRRRVERLAVPYSSKRPHVKEELGRIIFFTRCLCGSCRNTRANGNARNPSNPRTRALKKSPPPTVSHLHAHRVPHPCCVWCDRVGTLPFDGKRTITDDPRPRSPPTRRK